MKASGSDWIIAGLTSEHKYPVDGTVLNPSKTDIVAGHAYLDSNSHAHARYPSVHMANGLRRSLQIAHSEIRRASSISFGLQV